MGFRFQKRIRILPGVHINLSKTGISTSVGGNGLTVNLRGDKVKGTVGLPGTGMSYSETSRLGSGLPGGVVLLIIAFVLAVWFLI